MNWGLFSRYIGSPVHSHTLKHIRTYATCTHMSLNLYFFKVTLKSKQTFTRYLLSCFIWKHLNNHNLLSPKVTIMDNKNPTSSVESTKSSTLHQEDANRDIEVKIVSFQNYCQCFNLGFALLQTGNSAPALLLKSGFATSHF